MKKYDAAVIGAGVLGCFAARNLRKYCISTVIIEAEEDVCSGMTRANTAIVYSGCDNKSGSLKAEMTVRANLSFHELCAELGVEFSRCGSLMISFGETADKVLIKKLEQGLRNGVPGLRLLTKEEALLMEPCLPEDITSALYVPTTGTVNPWQLGIAAYENALGNGASAMTGAKVTAIKKSGDGYIITTENDEIYCRAVINCAGLFADKIRNLVYPSDVRLEIDGADFLIFDKNAPKPEHIIFHESENGKGITLVPCIEGNLLADSPPRKSEFSFATTCEGTEYVKDSVKKIIRNADTTKVIRSFGALRPNPRTSDGRSINDFCIECDEGNFFSLIGIKTPGLTCAQELGNHVARLTAEYLGAPPNEDFDPVRNAPYEKDGEIICVCENISKNEIITAIRRGAVSVDGVKRRVGATMGRCQGSRCSWAIRQLLEEYKDASL